MPALRAQPTPLLALSRAVMVMLVAMLLTSCAADDEIGGGDDAAAGDPASTASEDADGSDDGSADDGLDDGLDDEELDREATVDPSSAQSTDPVAPPATSAGEVAGVLGGSDIEGGCVWLDADDGTRYELVTGTDSQVRIDPANQLLVSADGEVIAESGDRVVIQGEVDEGLMTFCQVGINFVVEDARPE